MCQHRTILRRSLYIRVLQHPGHHHYYALWRHVKAFRIHQTVFADNGVSRNVAAFVDDRAVYATTFADDRAGRMTESSTREWIFTITLEKSSEWRTSDPEMMQPPDTIELTAMPRRS